jgi:large subunit ribosomal protein L4
MYRQKGTGNARMGAKRTNKRKGGGVAFARRNRDYSYSIPKKAVRAAIRMAILSKFQDKQAVVLDDLGPAAPDAKPQTKAVFKVLKAIPRPDRANPEAAEGAAAKPETLQGGSILLGLPESNRTLYLSARNIDGMKVAPVAEFNTYDVLRQRYLVLTRAALARLRELGKPASQPQRSSEEG